MKKIVALLLAGLLAASAFAQGVPGTAAIAGTTGAIGATGTASTTTSMASDSGDIAESVAFDTTVSIDLSSTTLGDKVVADDGTLAEGLTVARTAYGITITSKSSATVRYRLKGSLAGTLSVVSDGPYQLYLDGVTINAAVGPEIGRAHV